MPISFIDILCILLVLSGLLFFLGAAIGLLRFPDFYTRMHAAGKGDTLSTLLILGGASLYELQNFGTTGGSLLIVVRIMAIGVVIMLTSPSSTHALMQAGYDDKIEPVGEAGELRLQMPDLNPHGAQPVPAALPAAAAAPAAGLAAAPLEPDAQTTPATPAPVAKKKLLRRKVAKKATSKKSAINRATAKQPTTETTPAVKKVAATKKVASKKVPTKKAATKKAATKKVAAKKVPAKKAAATKKVPSKKAAAKKVVRARKKVPRSDKD